VNDFKYKNKYLLSSQNYKFAIAVKGILLQVRTSS